MKEKLIQEALHHNEKVDNYRNVDLKNHFGSDTITPEQWFEAQRMIKAQGFFDSGLKIVRALQKVGIGAKINALSEKIYCPEIGLWDR